MLRRRETQCFSKISKSLRSAWKNSWKSDRWSWYSKKRKTRKRFSSKKWTTKRCKKMPLKKLRYFKRKGRQRRRRKLSEWSKLQREVWIMNKISRLKIRHALISILWPKKKKSSERNKRSRENPKRNTLMTKTSLYWIRRQTDSLIMNQYRSQQYDMRMAKLSRTSTITSSCPKISSQSQQKKLMATTR